MDKKELREKMKQQLLELDQSTVDHLNERMVTHLFHSDIWQKAKTVGVTISQGFEWDTTPIIRRGWEEGKRMVVPKCFPESRELVFYQLDHFNQLEVVYYQLREPNPDQTVRVEKGEIDLIIVPGLVFDRSGYRIGFGGGYYDRFLADFPNETVSLLASNQLLLELPRETYDIPVQALITEDGLINR